MNDLGTDIKVTLTMVNFKNHDFDLISKSPNQTPKIVTIESKGSSSALSSPQEHEDRQIKQEPKGIKPSTYVDKGYYEQSEVIIEDKLSKKELFKIESIILKDKEQFSLGTET
eukprot:351840-Ditylum_brightwellii.AAC.1